MSSVLQDNNGCWDDSEVPFFNPKRRTFRLFPGQRNFSRAVFRAIEDDCLEACLADDPPAESRSGLRTPPVTRCPSILNSPSLDNSSSSKSEKTCCRFMVSDFRLLCYASREIIGDAITPVTSYLFLNSRHPYMQAKHPRGFGSALPPRRSDL